MKRVVQSSLTIHAFVLFTFPLALIAVNSNWIYTPPSLLPDPWFYLANFLYFFDFASSYPFNSHYFIERVTWNLGGHAVYQIFPPLIANYVLHLLVYYVAVFCLYLILSSLLSRRAGLLSALAMGSYPWFLRAVGWDYTDGVGTAHLLLVMWLFVQSVRTPRRSPIYMFLAGLVHASMLVTNVFWIGFAPTLALFYLLVEYYFNRWHIKRLFGAAACFFVGNVLMTAAVSLIYHSASGDYYFLRNSIAFSTRIVHDEHNVQALLDFNGRMPAYWNLLPVLVGIGAIFWLAFYSRKQAARHRFFAIVMILNFIGSYGWLVFWHYYSAPTLAVYFYCSFFIPATFLLFGAIFASSLETLSSKQFRYLTACTILILMTPLFSSVFFPKSLQWQHNDLLTVLMSVGLMVCLPLAMRNARSIPLVLAFIAIIGFVGGKGADGVFEKRLRSHHYFQVVMDVVQSINENYPKYRYTNFRLWYHTSINDYANIALASVYHFPWGSLVNTNPVDHFTWPTTAILVDSDLVLLSPSTDPEKILDEANAALSPLNAHLESKTYKRIRHGDLTMTVVFTRLVTQPLTIADRFDFDRPFTGENWYTLEKTDKDTTFAWSGPDNTSTMDFQITDLEGVEGDLQARICIFMALDPALFQSFRVYANDLPVDLTAESFPGCAILYEAAIPAAILKQNEDYLSLTFEIDHTLSPGTQDQRRLGLAFDWIEFNVTQ